MSAPIRVVVADDHPLYRSALADTVRSRDGLALVGEAAEGGEALRLLRERRPEVAVLDVMMPGAGGADVLAAVAREALGTRVILLTAYLESEAVYEAIGAGAAGYLSKDSGPDQICDAIEAVAAGGTVLGPEVQANVAGEIRQRASRERPALTPREGEILAMIADGRSGPEIGRRLNLSTATVKTHLQHLYEKLGVSDRAAAVAEAMRRGLIR